MKKTCAVIFAVIISGYFAHFTLASMKGSPMGSPKGKGSAMHGSPKGSMMHEEEAKAYAMAEIQGTQVGSLITGTVKLKEMADGLYVQAKLSNVTPPGKHGFHIHDFGSCANGGKAAGGHYNPGKTKHGLLAQDGPEHAHSGDMGNIVIGENGEGHYHGFLPGVSITGGKNNVAGRAVILHAKPDDFGQPTGNAGGRIGCGTIIITNE